jgi:hypothetical protein
VSIAGSDFASGERVRLLKLEDEFYEGIDPQDVAILKTLVGRIWTVDGMHEESGTVELIFKHRRGSPSPLRWVCVPPNWIERAS